MGLSGSQLLVLALNLLFLLSKPGWCVVCKTFLAIRKIVLNKIQDCSYDACYGLPGDPVELHRDQFLFLEIFCWYQFLFAPMGLLDTIVSNRIKLKYPQNKAPFGLGLHHMVCDIYFGISTYSHLHALHSSDIRNCCAKPPMGHIVTCFSIVTKSSKNFEAMKADGRFSVLK